VVLEGYMNIPASIIAICLGLTALVPFAVLSACLWLVAPQYQAAFAGVLLAYGASILGFLGGIHWGAGLSSDNAPVHVWQYVYGVCPALLAWAAVLAPTPKGLLLVAAGLVAALIVDRRVWAHTAWFVRLRTRLTALAVICLYAAYAAIAK